MARSFPASSFSLALLLASVAAFPAPVETSSPARSAERVDEVVVTAVRAAQPLQEFAGSVSVVNEAAVRLVGSTHHSELINRAAGALIQRNSGQESLTAIRSPVLSGPGSCGAFLFLENSIPIRPTGFCNVNELFEVNSEQADSIEVLRGPAGVVYGSGAMHGAVNVVQATPAELPRRSLALEAGPDDYYRGKIALSRVSPAIDAGGSLVVAHDGGWRAASGLEEQKLKLGLTRRLTAATLDLHLAATNLNQQTAGFIRGENAYRDAALAKSNPNPEAYRDAYAVRLTGQYERDLGEAATLAVRPFVRRSRMDFLQHFLIGKPLEENGQDSLGVLTTLTMDAFANATILSGLDLEFAEGFLKETQEGPATDGPPPANAIRPAGKHYDYGVRSSVAAVYSQLEQRFAEHWAATAGARAEYVEYDYDNRMIAGDTRDDGSLCGASGCLYARPADRTDTFTNVVAKLALTRSLGDGHMAYAAAVRGYRAPDTSELYRLQRQQSIAELDSERLDSFELGARGAFGALRYAVAAFVMEKDNVIFRNAEGFNVSDGRTDHQGVEYELTWTPGWTPHTALSLALAGSYAKHAYDFNAMEGGEQIAAGRDVDTAPRRINTARVSWRVNPSADAELEWQSIGAYFLDAANQHEYGGHGLLNLRLGWRLAEPWMVVLRLNNVTDRKYADRADFAFGDYRYFPGRRRTAFVEVRYEGKSED